MYPPMPVTRHMSASRGPCLRRHMRLPLSSRRLWAHLLLAPLVGVALWATMRHPAASPCTVYTVSALANRLASAHAAWSGRTVWVRGDVVTRLNQARPAGGGPGLRFMQTYLVDPVGRGGILFLFMDGPPNPVYATLRPWPLIGHLVPPPQVPHTDRLADYQVQLQIVPCLDGRPCDAAVLLDAAPFRGAP